MIGVVALQALCVRGAWADDIEITKGEIRTERIIDGSRRREGDTAWFYNCHPNFHFRKRPAGQGEVTILVDHINLDIGLEIRTALPPARTRKLEEHEEGHSEICRMIYAEAEQAAHDSCQAVLGQSFTGHGRTERDATDDAIDIASRAICDRYKEKTGKRADKISAAYDDITAHGFNPLPEKQAIRQAFKQADH